MKTKQEKIDFLKKKTGKSAEQCAKALKKYENNTMFAYSYLKSLRN